MYTNVRSINILHEFGTKNYVYNFNEYMTHKICILRNGFVHFSRAPFSLFSFFSLFFFFFLIKRNNIMWFTYANFLTSSSKPNRPKLFNLPKTISGCKPNLREKNSANVLR